MQALPGPQRGESLGDALRTQRKRSITTSSGLKISVGESREWVRRSEQATEELLLARRKPEFLDDILQIWVAVSHCFN